MKEVMIGFFFLSPSVALRRERQTRIREPR